MKPVLYSLIISLIFALLSAGCSVLNPETERGALQASGTITAQSVLLAPEIGGKVTEITAEREHGEKRRPAL